MLPWISVDLLAAPRLDAPRSKIPRAGSRREILRELCAVLSVVALKTPGPVFVIAPGTVFTCRAKDVAGWRLDLLEFNGGTGPRELCKRMRRALRRDKSPSHSPCPFTTVRLCSGEMWGTWAITEMHAASVRSFRPPRMLSTPYTVILLNFCSITSLHLSGAPIPVALLADVLVNLTITALDTFGIVDGIDPEILGEFLLRHPHLREFHHQATAYWPWSQIVGQIPSYSSLITPPIAHPGLRVIRADSAEDLDRVMEGLHLSPLLNVITFWHQPHATDHTFLVGLNSFFRLLSKRTNDLHLDLGIPQEVDPEQQFMDEEAADIARALHCIRSVDIVCKSTEMCLKTLPWFALFPALSSARFMLFRWWKGPQVWVDAELAGFLEQVRAALPQVEITVYPLEVVTEG